MNVPFMDLRRLTRELADDSLAEAIGACVLEADFIEGPRVAALEAELAAKLGVPHVVACGNGTDALILGLMAMGVRRGDTVAIPALTFWATFEAVVAIGAVPLLVDIDPEDLQLSADALVAAHERHRFKAAILVHLFGWASAQIHRIRSFCRVRGIALLEDGAQSFGVDVRAAEPILGMSLPDTTVPVLAQATVGTLSFYPAKVIGGLGDGGAVTCQSADRASALRSLRNHGRGAASYEHTGIGMNSRMGAIGAAYLSRVVGMADRILDDRRATLDFYRNRFDGLAGLKLWCPPAGVRGNGYLAVVTSDRKSGAELAAGLQARGIGCARTYPITIAEQWPARGCPAWGDLEVSRAFCRRVVNLPLFYKLEGSEAEAAVQAMLEVHGA